METISILIVDDHASFREACNLFLNINPHFNVVAECGSGEEAIDLAKQLCPNVILMDISLPGMNGLEATEQISKEVPDSKVLGFSLHAQSSYVRKMMQIGAMGYVTKNSSLEEITKAILSIYKGQKYICAEIKNILSEQLLTGNDQNTFLNSLSLLEMEVINFLKKGFFFKRNHQYPTLICKNVIFKFILLKSSSSLKAVVYNSYSM